MEDLSLHILDIVENSIVAQAKKIEISIIENIKEDLLTVKIKDDGKGMDEEMIKKSLDPFFTTKTTKKVGLGLPLLAQAAEESGGKLEIESEVGKGTTIMATFKLSHPDRRPLGNMKETMKILTVAHPEIKFIFEHKKSE
ncbi:MAG: ATP-binding protein [bacterium]